MAFDPTTAKAEAFDPSSATEERYGAKDAAVGPELMMTLGSGIGAQIASGIGGIAGAVLPGPPGQGADWQQRIAENLTYQPRGKLAGQAAQVAALPGEALNWYANKVGETETDLGLHPAIGAAHNALIQAAPAVAGFRTPKPRAPTVTEQAAAKYRDQGFYTTPAEGGGGFGARQVENLSGSNKLAKQISEKNIPLYEQKLGADLGLPKGTPLTQETLATVEKGAWNKYDAVRKSGRITTDPEYVKAMDKVEQNYKSVAEDFGEAAQKLGMKDTADTVNALRKDSFDANSAVTIVRTLREKANKAFTDGNGADARALRGAAKAIEDQIERHLERPQMGSDMAGFPVKSAVLEEFKAARTTLAKVHDARKALDKNQRLDPQKYAETLRKNPQVLSGGAREVAEFARANPRSAQKVVSPSINSTVGIGDVGLGMSAGAYHMLAHGLTGGAAIPASLAIAARPATRAFLASKAGQSALGTKMPPLTPGLERMLAVSLANRQLSDELPK